MNPDTMIVLILILAAIVSWLTSAAQLNDMWPGLSILLNVWRALLRAGREWRKGGRASIDRDALQKAVRPLVRAFAWAMTFAAAPVAVYEIAATGSPGLWCAGLCLALAVNAATNTPCPWIRCVFIGDRRHTDLPFDGADRRAR